MKGLVARTVVALFLFSNVSFAATDPLPSWNDSGSKKAIISFVEKVTREGSPDFVTPAERIATFDNDGTLWAEQPMYFQFLFALDRVKVLAPNHPEWKEQEPFASLLRGDIQGALAGGDRPMIDIVMATHAGMTTDEFEQIVKEWISTARHPVTKRLYTEMVYQPMLELLNYLRANGFKTFVVSGGGVEFMRPWMEKVYGIPPEQVVGSSIKTRFELREGKPVLIRLPEANFNDDKDGKPVGINLYIGRRPIAAFGNSDGDLQMLQYTAAGSGPHFCLYVHHTDAEREWAYDRESRIGQLDKGLDEAAAKGWTVVDMKNDWKRIFPEETAAVTAIDIALEPDASMVRRAEAVNSRLRSVYPQGFALDQTHQPHITLLQRYVRTTELDEIFAAVDAVLAKVNLSDWKLNAVRYEYVPWMGEGLASIIVAPTADLLQLQRDLIASVAPFTVETGSPEAFVTVPGDAGINQATMDYVAEYVSKHSGTAFNPHVTAGVADPEYLKGLISEPFVSFTFSPSGAAVYQIGNYGTARKKLKDFELNPQNVD